MVRVVCPSVYHTRISLSPKLSEIDVRLLEYSNRNSGLPIQNLPPDSRSEVGFRNFGLSGSALRPLRQAYAWSRQRSIGHCRRSVCYLAEISYDHTQKDSRAKTPVEIGKETRIPTPGGVISNLILETYSADDQDIVTKFVMLVENGISQRAEWSNIRFLQRSNMADGSHL